MKRWLFFLVAAVVFSQVAASAQNSGYNVTSDLWAKAVLQAPSGPVILDWKEVGSDITPSGDQVVSGYFYADPTEFAYGSEFNPEVFVKIYITADGWCNIAFNHVTVDDVDVYSAHNYNGVVDQYTMATVNRRLVEHQYDEAALGGTGEVVTIESLAGTYRLIGLSVTYDNGITITQDNLESLTGRMTIGLKGDVTQSMVINGESLSMSGTWGIIDENTILSSSAGMSLRTEYTYQNNILTTVLPADTPGYSYSETDVWQKISSTYTATPGYELRRKQVGGAVMGGMAGGMPR